MLVRTLKPHFDWLKPNFVCWRLFFLCVCVLKATRWLLIETLLCLGEAQNPHFGSHSFQNTVGIRWLQLKTMCVCWKPFFARKNKHILWTCWVIAASEAKLWHVVPDTTSFNAAIAALGKSLLWEKDRHIFEKNVGYLNPPNTAKNGKTM